jgi:superfamily I DNA/RNA helicase
MAKIALRVMELSLTPDPMGRICFDDMLFIPAALGLALPLYDWVIVDEAQDMNLAQLKIARQACKPNGHIVVVGDDRQAIYGFRGADSDAVDRLKAELNAEELGLTTTYRCPKKVVELARALVPDFEHPEWAPDGEVDEIAVDEIIEHAVAGDVILSRLNAPLVPLCLSFIRRGVGARIEGRDIGKLLAARAKKLKATSVEDFLMRLTKWASRAASRVIARGQAVDARLQQIRDVEATLAALAEEAPSVQAIYDRCEKMFADVAENGSAALIVLSTVHKAKGLEWRRVFVLNDTFFEIDGRREEANIKYVALTRSMQRLTLVKGQHAAA